ncbi:MAG TPA: TonB family protein [Terriglobia bacterium]|nr:TonB family protein [Terriglobia bacterium]
MSSKELDTAPQFGLLEVSSQERRRWRASCSASLLVQAPLVLLVLWFVAGPPRLREPSETRGVEVTLVTPPAAALPHPKRLFHLPPQPPSKRIVERISSAPKPILPREERVVPPKPLRSALPLPRNPPIVPPETAEFKPVLPKWKPQTHVGEFESSRAAATLKLPQRKVQTGGFGDPQGISGEAKSEGNVAHLGSFDRPEGPGSGNGTAGAKGARGLVASAGFGDGIASGLARSGASGPGQIHSAGFQDVQSMTRAVSPAKSQPQVAAFVPVEITSKPDPVYTDEARRLHIQGEVILRVDFTASGQVRVLSVEQRLGHGLDLAADRAAEEIQFKPAQRNGKAVDTDATLRILFRLAD